MDLDQAIRGSFGRDPVDPRDKPGGWAGVIASAPGSDGLVDVIVTDFATDQLERCLLAAPAGTPAVGADCVVIQTGDLPIAVVAGVPDLVAPATYAPAWIASGSNPSLGDGTLTGRFTRVGKLVFVAINLVAGSTTTFGTGTYNLSLPVTAKASVRQVLPLQMPDTAVQHYTGVGVINGGTTFEEIVAGSNATGPANWTPTVPFTFGNGDRVNISGVYEAA